MYITTERQGSKVLIWYRDESDTLLTKSVDAPYYFYVEDDNGAYKNIYGQSLKRLDYASNREMRQAKEVYEKIKPLYESDIAPELKILSEQYYNQPAPNLHYTGYDIEVDYDEDVGFPAPILNANFEPDDYIGDFEKKEYTPYAPINSVSIYNFWENINYCLAVPPESLKNEELDVNEIIKQMGAIEPLDLPTKVILFKDERELLLKLIEIIQDSDIFFGWNSDTFDNPYVAQRIMITLGEKYFNMLSYQHASKPKFVEIEKFGEDVTSVEFGGRVATDYLEIYKKFTIVEKPSYKLESIAEEELPTMRKLEYSGSLSELYNNDFIKFLRYNIRDTEILYGFESKLGYLALANEMYHNTTGLFKHIFGTLKNTELAMINYCHHELDDIKVPDCKVPNDGRKIDGAYVLTPKVGHHKHIASVDISSLYTSTIRSNNISPDTIIGQFTGEKKDFNSIQKLSNEMITLVFDSNYNPSDPTLQALVAKTTLTLEARKWVTLFKKLNWSISGFGTVFTLEYKGILTGLLESWYANRKERKKLSFKFAKQAEAVADKSSVEYTKLKEQADYYDRLQYVAKIALNSAYGALCNKYFRFYDLRLGASTTATGQEILKHQTSKVNELLGGDYDIHGKHIIYGDTDSVFSDAKIIFNNGLENSIEELFHELPITTIIGDKEYAFPMESLNVMSYDPITKQPIEDSALCVYRRKVKKNRWVIVDEFGNSCEYTEDHSVMVERDGGKLIEITPAEILPDDVIITLEKKEV